MSIGDKESSLGRYTVRPFFPPELPQISIISFVDGGEELEKVIVSAYERYCVSNPIHPDVFPAIRKMEAEIVAMCLKLYNNPDGAGAMTSGGTESIIMAVKAHRDWARAIKGITEPEMYDIHPSDASRIAIAKPVLLYRIIPASAHAAFYKGAQYFKIKHHMVPVDPITRKADIKRVKRAMSVFPIRPFLSRTP